MRLGLDERVRFLSTHWRDAMGWKAIPFWCVFSAEGFYAAKPQWAQLCILAAGVVMSWAWGRSLLPLIESRIGVMRQPAARPQKGVWKKSLLVLVPLIIVQGLVASLLSGHHRQQPLGWSEHLLPGGFSAYLAVQAMQIVDSSNLRSRRLWYTGVTLLCVVQLGALGYEPESYTLGFILFGLAQCVLALADLFLLVHLAGPLQHDEDVEVSRG